MKKLILLFTFALFSTPGITQLLYYTENIEIENITSEQAIKKIKKWAAINFSNYKEALQYEDNNTLILNGTVRSILDTPVGTYVAQSNHYTYKIVIAAEENNIKVDLKDFATRNGNTSYPTVDRETSIKSLEETRLGKRMKQNLINDRNAQYDSFDETAEWIFNGIVDALNN